MAIRHRRFTSVPPMLLSTRRSRSFDVMPTSRASRAYLMTSPLSRADKVSYDRQAESYLNNRVSDAGYLSSYAMEEGYDTARRSRNRDAQLLRDATDAIVYSESFATPQASVAARRVGRGLSMVPLRASSLPPRPLYPAQVDFWGDAPASYESLYGPRTADTTTTDYYPELSYTRRPLLFYPNPWLYRSPSRVGMARFAERARSVPPAFSYPEEPRRQPRPVFDDWRRYARATSVSADLRPYYARPLYYPYAGDYGRYQRSLSPYYARRLSLSPTREMGPVWPMPTQGLAAHRAPRYLSRVASRAGVPIEWDEQAARHRREDDAEDLARMGFRAAGYGYGYGYRPRVLGSPLARANLARAWRHAAPSFASPFYVKESGYGFPLVYVARKGSKQGGHRPKAALIANKLEYDSCKGRRPRSEYAARKYRALRMGDQESIYSKAPQTTGYYASNVTMKRRW